jgi:hypothetical protein
LTINSTNIPNKHKLRKEQKMARTKNRIKKMTFQTQDRKYEPLSDNDKYIIKMAGYQKELMGKQDEEFQRSTGRVARPQYI